MIEEKKYRSFPGVAAFLVLLTLMIGCLVAMAAVPPLLPVWLALLILLSFLMKGFVRVQPNQGAVLQFFGRYVGTVREPGLRWTNPLYSSQTVSLRVRNFETSKLKVNDNHGNPIEIGAVVVWRVTDTAEATFEVDDYQHFVEIQSEAAVRNLASSYPYDAQDTDERSLVSDQTYISERLREENQKRLKRAGIEIIESRISHLAYSPEIAQAMLRRQQAGAIIGARRLIVDGAVGMVQQAIDELSKREVVILDEERKAAMVSNLLVVLCSESATQPIVNTGSIY